jgi:hypothetical protein
METSTGELINQIYQSSKSFEEDTLRREVQDLVDLLVFRMHKSGFENTL